MDHRKRFIEVLDASDEVCYTSRASG